MNIGIITVSDRASRGEYEDQSGPALRTYCERQNWSVSRQAVVPDEVPSIQREVIALTGSCDVVLLTGGSGIAERDVTIEAVRAIAHKELPGFGEVMRAKSFERFPHAILSRASAFTRDRSLIICLPGSPKGAVECIDYVAAAVPHAVDLLRGSATH